MAPKPADAMDRDELVAEVERLRIILAQQMEAAPGIADVIGVEGLVSRRTGEPFVQMRAGEAVWQFTTAQARTHGLATLERAVEAERDAATIRFVKAMGMEDENASFFLSQMRDAREQVTYEVTAIPVEEEEKRES